MSSLKQIPYSVNLIPANARIDQIYYLLLARPNGLCGSGRQATNRQCAIFEKLGQDLFSVRLSQQFNKHIFRCFDN